MTYSDVLRNDTLSTYLHKGSQAPLTVSFTMVDMSSRSCRAFPVPRNSPSQGPPQVTGSEDVFLPGGRVHCNGISGVEPRPRAPKTDATNTAVPLNHGTTCRCNTHDGHRGNNNNPAPPSQTLPEPRKVHTLHRLPASVLSLQWTSSLPPEPGSEDAGRSEWPGCGVRARAVGPSRSPPDESEADEPPGNCDGVAFSISFGCLIFGSILYTILGTLSYFSQPFTRFHREPDTKVNDQLKLLKVRFRHGDEHCSTPAQW